MALPYWVGSTLGIIEHYAASNSSLNFFGFAIAYSKNNMENYGCEDWIGYMIFREDCRRRKYEDWLGFGLHTQG